MQLKHINPSAAVKPPGEAKVIAETMPAANAEVTPTVNAEVTPTVDRVPLSKPDALRVLLAGAVVGLLYAVCFSGIDIWPQISFTIFCPVVLLILTGMLKTTGHFKNKKALWWALPLMILALFNGLFYANVFTWFNTLLAHILFAAYLLTAVRQQPLDLFNLSGLLSIIRTICGDWIAFFSFFRIKRKAEAALPAAVPTKPSRMMKVFLGVIIALPVLLVIITLLASADAIFGRMLESIYNRVADLRWLSLSFILSFVLVWIYAVGYVCLGIRRSRIITDVAFPDIKADVTICATFLSLVNAVFLLFTFIQAAFLFNGGFMRLPEDMVYSQYAREGFFQLLFVTVINFSVITVFMTALTGVKNSPLLKGLLLALCVFTGVLIVSSFYRMGLYTGAYGHTTLRLCVYTFLAMEVALLAVTLWKLVDSRVHFVKYYALIGLLFYLTANVTGSDWMSAQLNKSLFLSGEMSYIDLRPVGPDGLEVLKPLLVNEEDYVCHFNQLMTREDFEASGDTMEYVQRYMDLRRVTTDSLRYWQNWSYLAY